MERGLASDDDSSILVSIIDDHPDLCYGVLARLPKANSSFVAGPPLRPLMQAQERIPAGSSPRRRTAALPPRAAQVMAMRLRVR